MERNLNLRGYARTLNTQIIFAFFGEDGVWEILRIGTSEM